MKKNWVGLTEKIGSEIIELYCPDCCDYSIFTNIANSDWQEWLAGSKQYSECKIEEKLHCIKCNNNPSFYALAKIFRQDFGEIYEKEILQAQAAKFIPGEFGLYTEIQYLDGSIEEETHFIDKWQERWQRILLQENEDGSTTRDSIGKRAFLELEREGRRLIADLLMEIKRNTGAEYPF